MIEINRNPSQRELRWFGALFLLFFVLVGAIIWWRFGGRNVALVMWLIAAGVTVIYSLAPPIRRPLYLGWMYAAFPIGWLVSHLLLAIIYFGMITPIGLFMRLLGRDPMKRPFDREADSYWIPRRPTLDAGRYFRQF